MKPSDDDIREEIESHLAMRAAHEGGGEAAARRRFGNVLQTQETIRQVWIAQFWDKLFQDARFTWRSWRRNPGFALTSVLVLALWCVPPFIAIRRQHEQTKHVIAITVMLTVLSFFGFPPYMLIVIPLALARVEPPVWLIVPMMFAPFIALLLWSMLGRSEQAAE